MISSPSQKGSSTSSIGVRACLEFCFMRSSSHRLMPTQKYCSEQWVAAQKRVGAWGHMHLFRAAAAAQLCRHGDLQVQCIKVLMRTDLNEDTWGPASQMPNSRWME